MINENIQVYNRLVSKILRIFFFMIILILAGIFGYIMIENYTFLEACWMTLMTVTTVGFGEMQGKPLSDNGKILTMFLMVFGVSFVVYSLGALASELFDGNLIKALRNRKMESEIKNLKDHVIICGFGRNGRQAARKLILNKQSFIIIDLREFQPTKGDLENLMFLQGNSTKDEVLIKAGIMNAKALISALPEDADNLFVVISAKQLNPNLKIVSRASNSNSIKKLKIAGADNVIMPDKIGGEHMASLIVTPDIVEFLDNISLEGSSAINLIEIPIKNIPQEFFRKTLGELPIKQLSGCNIIGYKNKKQQYELNPSDDLVLNKEDFLIIFGKPHQITTLKAKFNLEI